MAEFIQRSPEGATGDAKSIFEARAGKGSEVDARIEIASNGLEALVNLYPPRGDGALLTLELAQEAFEHLNISHEVVDWGGLQDKLLECNLNRNAVTGFVAAKGIPPIPEVPEHLVLLETFVQGSKRDFDDKATIDYRAESPSLLCVRARRSRTSRKGSRARLAGTYSARKFLLPKLRSSSWR